MNRLKDKWSTPKRDYLTILGDDKEFNELFNKRVEKYSQKNDEERSFYRTIFEDSVEVILTKEKERGYVLNPIMQCLDSFTLQLVQCQILELYGFEDDDDLKGTIAYAMMMEAPVYGNNSELQEFVDNIQEDIIKNGFKEDGKRYTLTAYSDYNTKDHNEIIKRLNQSTYITRAEINLLSNSVSFKFKEYTNAANFLTKIESVIDQLSTLLNSEIRNENKLQEFITNNPIVLGTEYKTVIPKHKLGAEYEMDYALQRFDGVFDLVELESSNLPLFNKNGQPSHHLVHAEQQILDWQEWLEDKNFYGREKLENIKSPIGIVVIGRNHNTDLQKLRRRNISFSNYIKIYTYDQILQKLVTLNENIKRGDL